MNSENCLKGVDPDHSQRYMSQADGARRSVAEIPDRSQKIADAFGLK